MPSTLHPILATLMETFPSVFTVDSDLSLTVLDRDFFDRQQHTAPQFHTCVACKEVVVQLRGQTCEECLADAKTAAIKAREPRVLPPVNVDRPIPTTLTTKPVPEPELTFDVATELQIIGGVRPGVEPILLPRSVGDLSAFFQTGIPEGVPLAFRPDVLDLFGVDLPMAISVVREPNSVVIDDTVEDRDYPVLRFRRGDLYVVVGFRSLAMPAVLGVYASAQLKHDGYEVSHTGGGGSKDKHPKVPSNPRALLKRLQQMGVKIGEPDEKGLAQTTYEGQSLGKVRAEGSDYTNVRSDYDRIQRKVYAINQKEEVKAS